jgi:hypothetical protein
VREDYCTAHQPQDRKFFFFFFTLSSPFAYAYFRPPSHPLTHLQLGPILDETGQISSGKLILSDTAWTQLLGRSAEQLVFTSLDILRYLEQRLLFLRVTMGFAMSLEDEIGRLAIWYVNN